MAKFIPSWVRGLPGIKQLSNYYKGHIDREMRGWGLRMDDLTTESSEAYQRALRLLPPDVWEARSRRLTRCTDMSAKHTHLQDAAYHAQQPNQSYCKKLVEDLERRRNERETYR